MKRVIYFLAFASSIAILSCESAATADANLDVLNVSESGAGQSAVSDETSNPNIVQVASGSKDHSTLVIAVKAAGLVDAQSNAGPFTVFAPTNAAFNKLPKGTVDGLLKPEKKGDLENILGYHTYVGVLKTDYMQDGQAFDMVYGGKVKITKTGDETYVNGSEIVATITTSNGVIHVIEDVLLPK